MYLQPGSSARVGIGSRHNLESEEGSYGQRSSLDGDYGRQVLRGQSAGALFAGRNSAEECYVPRRTNELFKRHLCAVSISSLTGRSLKRYRGRDPRASLYHSRLVYLTPGRSMDCNVAKLKVLFIPTLDSVVFISESWALASLPESFVP